jgi:Xaa-Pro aminopeptidase
MSTKTQYTHRRKQLADAIGEEALAIISAGVEQIRNGDAHYRFRQQSDFYYLTGFNEPNAVLIILGGKNGESILFNRVKNPQAEQWTGERLGQANAISQLHVDAAYAIEELSTWLPKLCLGKKALYYAIGQDPLCEPLILKTILQLKTQTRSGLSRPVQLGDLEPILSEMRLFKSTDEIALIQKACDISVMAHREAMKACSKLQFEYQLEAQLLYTFTEQGCRDVAYDSIVACGKHACILHYTANNGPLRPGELVLIDAAGEYENYAADITRTFPVNGTFTAEQRAIYELVLLAQRTAMKKVKPGLHWSDLQETIVQILTAGLRDLGILKGALNELIETQAYKPFYMHSSGHWLGLDVHDAGHYKQDETWRTLQPNMVFTIEPGLYISESDAVDPKWWNIGIRIEDDVLVKPHGYANLTADLPVEIDEIEALIRG